MSLHFSIIMVIMVQLNCYSQTECDSTFKPELQFDISLSESSLELYVKNLGDKSHIFLWSDALPYTDVIERVQFNVFAIADEKAIRIKRIENIPLYDLSIQPDTILPGDSLIKNINLEEFQQAEIIEKSQYIYCQYAVKIDEFCKLEYSSNRISLE